MREQYSGERGYNPGSQLIQIAGISVLNKLDHYIKEQMHCKLYLRFMDDFLVICETREEAEYIYKMVSDKLYEMDFEINHQKTRIYKITDGIPFLGFIFCLTDTGKVLMMIKPQNVKNERKKLFRMSQKVKRGEMDAKVVYESYKCWRAHASKGNNFKLIIEMDAYLHSLMEVKK